jgi:outer membrane immunogenic protein
MNTKVLLLTTVSSLGLIGAVQAADMPVKAPPMAAPVHSWTGCYLGGGGGYGMWNQDTAFFDPTPDTVTQTGGGRGWFGTVQVGCDYQLNSNWVIGAFGDWDFGSIRGTPHFSVDAAGHESEKWAWSAGARIGYLITPTVLTFVSAGYRAAHFDRVDLFDEFGSGSLGLFIPAHTYSGWFFGGGYEYALSWAPGLFWKTEYRYAEFSGARLPQVDSTTGLANTNFYDSKKFEQTIRTELVWRFNWGRY